MSKVYVFDHPLIQHKVSMMRDKNTTTKDFRQLAQEAGFVFETSSEINANETDTKDHPFGVDTLAPQRLTAPRGQAPDPTFDRSKYDAIGESDRMTLKFRKPE